MLILNLFKIFMRSPLIVSLPFSHGRNIITAKRRHFGKEINIFHFQNQDIFDFLFRTSFGCKNLVTENFLPPTLCNSLAHFKQTYVGPISFFKWRSMAFFGSLIQIIHSAPSLLISFFTEFKRLNETTHLTPSWMFSENS